MQVHQQRPGAGLVGPAMQRPDPPPGIGRAEQPPAQQEPKPDEIEAGVRPAALEAWKQLQQVHALLTGEVEALLRSAGLPPLAWYDALSALYEAPGRRLRHHELAERILRSRSGLSRLVDRLERAGAIERQGVEADRRGADVVLTDAGIELMSRMWPLYAETLERHFAQPLGIYASGVRDGLASVVRPMRKAPSA